MPEGDTVYRAGRLLDESLSGKQLLRTDFRVPQHATVDLSGATVTSTITRGKHLLTRIDEPSGRAWTLHTHLKMEGAWRVLAPGRRWPRPEHQARVVLEVLGRTAVGFSLGIVELLPRSAESDMVGHLGPDLLGPGWDEAEALRRLRADGRTIGAALLEQRNLAGIGTMWMAETLFLTGVDPYVPVTEVPDLAKVVRMAYRLLQANKERAIQATTGNTRRGEERYVYGRGGQPCRRCGTRIRTSDLGPLARMRVTFWCPHCQGHSG